MNPNDPNVQPGQPGVMPPASGSDWQRQAVVAARAGAGRAAPSAQPLQAPQMMPPAPMPQPQAPMPAMPGQPLSMPPPAAPMSQPMPPMSAQQLPPQPMPPQVPPMPPQSLSPMPPGNSVPPPGAAPVVSGAFDASPTPVTGSGGTPLGKRLMMVGAVLVLLLAAGAITYFFILKP